MWSVSRRFLTGLTTSGRMLTKVNLYRGSVIVAENIAITSGQVAVDGNSNVRRTLTMEVADQALLRVLDPYECDVRVWRGMLFANNIAEWVPVGVFRVWDVSYDRPGLTISVTAKDRGALVDSDEFIHPTESTGDVLVVDEVYRFLAGAGFPGCEIRTTHRDTVGNTVVWDGTRWEAINALADSLDAVVFFDQVGNPVIAPDGPGLSVWSVEAGPDGVLVGSSVSLTREGVYNCVVTEGENPESTEPIRSVVKDLDPHSPTYWRELASEGGFGHSVRKEASSVWNTQTKCDRAAQRLLRASVGKVRTVDLSAVPNPALDAGDVITVRYVDGSREELVIDSFTLPLVGGPFEMQARSSRTLSI